MILLGDQRELVNAIGRAAEAAVLALQEHAHLVTAQAHDVGPGVAVHVADGDARHVEQELDVAVDEQRSGGQEVVARAPESSNARVSPVGDSNTVRESIGTEQRSAGPNSV